MQPASPTRLLVSLTFGVEHRCGADPVFLKYRKGSMKDFDYRTIFSHEAVFIALHTSVEHMPCDSTWKDRLFIMNSYQGIPFKLILVKWRSFSR